MAEELDLGEIIRMLERCPKEAAIGFDFGGTTPTKCHSYRGYYTDLAIGFDLDAYPGPLVSEVLADLKHAVGRAFTGWKGGEFIMREGSRVWVANPGKTSGTVVVDVMMEGDYRAIILTEWVGD